MELEKIGLTGLVSALVALLVNHLTFKSKTNEIKLSNYYKDRIDTVKTLYGLIVEMHYASTGLFNSDSKDWDLDNYRASLKIWLSSFSTVNKYYKKNKILLVESIELNSKIDIEIAQMTLLRREIRKEYNTMIEMDIQFGDIYEERKQTMKWIENFISKNNVNQILCSFYELETVLELYFVNIVSTKSRFFWRKTS